MTHCRGCLSHQDPEHFLWRLHEICGSHWVIFSVASSRNLWNSLGLAENWLEVSEFFSVSFSLLANCQQDSGLQEEICQVRRHFFPLISFKFMSRMRLRGDMWGTMIETSSLVYLRSLSTNQKKEAVGPTGIFLTFVRTARRSKVLHNEELQDYVSVWYKCDSSSSVLLSYFQWFPVLLVFKRRAPPERRLAKAAYLSHHALIIVVVIIVMGYRCNLGVVWIDHPPTG